MSYALSKEGECAHAGDCRLWTMGRPGKKGGRSMFRAKIHVGAVALAVFAASLNGSPAAQEKSRVISVPEVETAGEPILVFKSFEKAWRDGDAQALSALASDSPVLVEIRGIERRGGYFTKSQVLYIMKDLFGGTSQLSFEFVKYHNIEKQDRRVYGIAQRSYRVKQNGGLFKDKVYVTLVRERSRWAVAEIKSTW